MQIVKFPHIVALTSHFESFWSIVYHFRRLQKIRQCIYQYRDRTWKYLLGFLFRNLFLCWLELFELHDRRAPRSLQKSTSSYLYLVTYSHIFVYHGKCCLFIRPITNWNAVLRCYRSCKYFPQCAQCENYMIFLSLRFSVKSFSGILEVQKLPFFPHSEALNFSFL